MKKVLLLLLAFVTLNSYTYAQKKFNYKVGVVTQIPANFYQTTTVDVGSSMAEVNYKYSEIVRLTLNSGFLRFTNSTDNSFTNVPVLLGARCFMSKTMYIGASSGVAFFNKEVSDPTKIMWNSYVGVEKGHFSVNLQYINWYKFDNTNNNLSLCISYIIL
jgi:hypothetical protein